MPSRDSEYAIIDSAAKETQSRPPCVVAKPLYGAGEALEQVLSPGSNWGQQRDALRKALIRAAEYFRGIDPRFGQLDGIKQMAAAAYTVRGARSDHTRWQHSLDCAVICYDLAVAIGCNQKECALAFYGGLFHDYGHSAFSHSGDNVLASAQKDRLIDVDTRACDHDYRVLQLLEQNKLVQNLVSGLYAGIEAPQLKISPTHLVCLLADSEDDVLIPRQANDSKENSDRKKIFHQSRFLHTLVKEFGDPLAYLRQDYASLHFPVNYHAQIAALPGLISKVIRVVDENGVRTLRFTSQAFPYVDSTSGDAEIGSVGQLLMLRRFLFQEGNSHPAAVLANEIIEEGLRELFESKNLTVDDYLRMTDDAVFELLPARAKRWLSQKVENCFTPVVWWGLDEFDPSKMCIVESPEFIKQLKSALQQVFPAKCYKVCIVPKNGKAVELQPMDNQPGINPPRLVGRRLTDEPLPQHRRLFAAVDIELLRTMHKDGSRVDISQLFVEARGILGKIVAQHLKQEGPDPVQINNPLELFKDLDNLLFIAPEQVLVRVS